MHVQFFIKVLVLCVFTPRQNDIVKAATLEDVERLHSELFKDYKKKILPQMDSTEPIRVNVSFNLISIKDFDEVNGKFSISGYFYVFWIDNRLTWNPQDYNNTYGIYVKETELWKPTIALVNPYDKIDNLGNGDFVIYLFYTGVAVWAPGDVISSTCSSDVTYFPFDEQICRIDFNPWGFTSQHIIFQASTSDIQLYYFSPHGTWELLQNNVTALSTHVSNGQSFIFVTINMRRRAAFFVVNIVIPILFMMTLNILAFVLPVECGERVSFSITVLLALAVFLTIVADNLPKTSAPMSLLSYFLLGSLAQSSLSCFMTVLSIYVYYKSDDVPMAKLTSTLTRMCVRGSGKRRNVICPSKKTKDGDDPKTGRLGDVNHNEDDKVTWKNVSGLIDILMIVLNCGSLCGFILGFFPSTVNWS